MHGTPDAPHHVVKTREAFYEMRTPRLHVYASDRRPMGPLPQYALPAARRSRRTAVHVRSPGLQVASLDGARHRESTTKRACVDDFTTCGTSSSRACSRRASRSTRSATGPATSASRRRGSTRTRRSPTWRTHGGRSRLGPPPGQPRQRHKAEFHNRSARRTVRKDSTLRR